LNQFASHFAAPSPKHARSSIDLILVKAKETHRWVKNVKTASTYPPEGLFTKDAQTIARSLASKKVSPKGPASGMRMLNYFINRGGKGLSEERHAELEKAKGLLSERIRASNKKASAKRSS
jgi:tRNA(adenine34) deaminase